MSLSLARCVRLIGYLSLAVCAVASPLTPRAITPTADPFYQPPAGFASKAPGTILKSRPIIAAALGLIPAANVQSYQLLYRTEAIDGTAIAAVTTVFKPVGAMKDRFVSFHTAYDASAPICDPSYSYQLLSTSTDFITSFEFLLLEAYLLSGYIVSSPDYEGPQAAFSAGRLAGKAVLDSMRAVTNFKSTLGFTTDTPKIVGYGYSGGAIATGWAASLQPTYAPELPIKGWAQGGTPANLTGTAVFLDNTAFSGFLPPAVVGLSTSTAYGATLAPRIKEIITPYGQSLLDFAKTHCTEDLFNFSEMSFLSKKVQSEGDRLYYDPVIAAAMKQTIMGSYKNETPTAPVYLYHAVPDEIIPYDNATTLVNAWCGYGASVDFVTFANGGHLTTEILGFVGAFKFVQSAFAGAVASGCSRSTVLSNSLNPVALGVSLEPILLQLVNALAQLGNQDSKVISNLSILKQPVSTSG